MRAANPEYLPEASLSREEMLDIQRKVAETSVCMDNQAGGEGVVGVDQAFTEDAVVSAAVAVKDGKPSDKLYSVAEQIIPYVPGFLSFREGGAVAGALEELTTTPEYVLFDGSGRIHPRLAGLATHMGVVFDVPSIGVAKNLLCGTPDEPLDEPLGEGERVPIFADESVDAPDGEVIGYAYQSKQYESGDRHVNPLYVSPGHRVSPETAVDVVEKYCSGYKLPEPVRLADRYADEVKRGLLEESL